MSTARFTISLDDQMSGPAEDGAAALERLKASMAENMKALRDMAAASGRLKGKDAEVVGQKKLLADKMQATRDAIAKAQVSYLKMGGSLDELGKKTVVADVKSASFTDSLNALGSPMGGRIGQLKQMAGALASPAGLMAGAAIAALAMAAGLVALGVAVAAVTAKLAVYAFTMSDAARSNRILLEAAGGGAAGADRLGMVIDGVARRVPTARQEIQGLITDLAKLGFQGPTLEAAATAIATATSTLGQDAGGKLKGIIEQAKTTKKLLVNSMSLQGTGVALDDVANALAARLKTSAAAAKAALVSGSVKWEEGIAALNDAVGKKLGGAAQAQMLALPNQFARAKENISKMFSGLKLDGALKALDKVLSLLDESTVTGNALKRLVVALFQPMADSAEKAGPVVVRVMKGAVVMLLQVALGALRAKNAIKQWIADNGPGVQMLKTTLFGVAVVLGAIAAVVVGAVVAAFVVMAAMAYVAGNAVQSVVDVYGALKDGLQAAWDKAGELDWKQLGVDIIKGIVAGIVGGGPGIGAALAGQLLNSLATAKKSIESSSPSRLFKREVGATIPEGVAAGVDDGTPDVEASVRAMVQPPPDVLSGGLGRALAPRGGGAARAGGGRWELHIHAADAQSVLDSRGAILRFLEDVAESAGLGPEAQPV